MKSMNTMNHSNPAIHQLTDMTMKMFSGARRRFGTLTGIRSALLSPRVVEPPAPPPPPSYSVEEVEEVRMEDVSPQKSEVPFFHPHMLEDGVTHLNIDSRANTELGKMLTHLYESKFIHPEYGPFQSMEGFWAFVRNNGSGNLFRTLHGMPARRASQKVKSRKIDGFYEIILEANYEKIVQNTEGLAELLKESDLPFEHYYIYGNKAAKIGAPGHLIRPPVEQMMVKIMTEIRNHLKAGTKPPKPDYSNVTPKAQPSAAHQKH